MEDVVEIEASPSCTLCGAEVAEMLLVDSVEMVCGSCGWSPKTLPHSCSCMASVMTSSGTDTTLIVSLSRGCFGHMALVAGLLGRKDWFGEDVEEMLEEQKRREDVRLAYLGADVGRFGKRGA